MDLASAFAMAAGSSVLAACVTVIANGIFGRAKARADVAGLYNQMAADTAVRNRELVGAIEKLTDAVDLMVPAFNLLIERAAPHLTDAEVVDIAQARERLRASSAAARIAI